VDLTKHLKLQTRLGNGAASVQEPRRKTIRAAASVCCISSNIRSANIRAMLSERIQSMFL